MPSYYLYQLFSKKFDKNFFILFKEDLIKKPFNSNFTEAQK